MISPIGAEIEIARPSTNSVLSKIERTITLPTLGGRYEGNSSVNDEGVPLRNVFESSLDITRVTPTLKIMIAVKINAALTDFMTPESEATKNIEIIAIMVGNLPLHGTKQFVRIAIRRSLGESMILQPTIPAALQPKPIAMHRLCLPQALHF